MAADESNGFDRWQSITREHLGATTNLLLGLATGLLAFLANLVLERKLSASGSFGIGIAALVLLTLSVGVALLCSLNRLHDFRLTAQIVRRREQGEPELVPQREKARSLGEGTWRLFRFQVWLFGLGAAAGALAVVLQVV